jgi:type VI secretion system protein ImpJ
MKSLQPVVWAKGTFLTPQHLQVQNRFLENVLYAHVTGTQFRPWGFAEVLLNQEALSQGVVSFSRASGIMPDGLPFSFPDADSLPPERQLAECIAANRNDTEIFLALPLYREKTMNVAMGADAPDTRYRSIVRNFRDENNGIIEKPVHVASKNFRFLTDLDPHEGYAVMGAARILRTEAGVYRQDPQYVPPILNVAASEPVMAIVRRLVEILTTKSTMLASSRRQRKQSLADFTATDIANFWLLYTANTYLPLLRHFYEVRRGHPETLYQTMLALAGSLTTFSFEIRPQDLPVYDHTKLGECILALDEKIRILLETVVPSNCVSIPLKLTQPFIYAAALDNEKYLHDTKMYLAVSSKIAEQQLISRVPMLVKTCSATHIDHLVKQALPGITLTHVPSPPSAIPVKLDYQYFSLNQSGPAWEAVTRARNFAAYVPADFPSPELELVILLPRAQGK